MKNKYYTAERKEDGGVLVYLPGAEYGLELDFARRLRDSLTAALDHGLVMCACGHSVNDHGLPKGCLVSGCRCRSFREVGE